MNAKNSGMFLFIVILCSTAGQFATEIYLPSMPAMATYFKVQMSVIQLTITTYAFGFAFGSFFSGYISDKNGRLAVLFPCAIIAFIGSLLCSVSTSADLVLVGRFIQGVGLGGVGVVARSIIRDVSTNKMEFAKFASILGSVSAIAIAFAPIVGGYIEKYLYWRVDFFFLLVFTAGLSWLCKYKLIETNTNRGNVNIKLMLKDYYEVLKNKEFLLYNCVSSLTLAGFISYQTVSSYLLQVQVGLEPDKFGFTSVAVTVALIIGGLFNGKMVERRGVENMLKFGAIIYLIAGGLYVLGGLFNYMTVVSILLPMTLFTFSAGIMYPNASSGALSLFTDKAGTTASIYNCFQMIGAGIGSWIIASIRHKTQLPLGIMFVFISMSALLIYYQLKLKQVNQIQ